MTDYIVLARQTDGSWKQLNTDSDPVSGRDDKHAIQVGTADLGVDEKAGTFLAVPVRNFKPRTRGVETVTKDVWS